MRRQWFLAALVASLAACVQTNSPWMFPGENCISCHNQNGQAFKKPWTAAGTIYDPTGDGGVEGAQVLIVDARGQSITITSNGVGNFYTAEDLQAPFQKVSVGWDGGWIDMPILDGGNAQFGGPVTGACNYCHNANGAAGIPVCVEHICGP